MISWFAVYCHSREEAKAAYHLKRQGFEVYLPRYLRRRRHARRIDVIPSPLFPRYLFAGMDTESKGWQSIQSTVGVSHLVGTGGVPTRVSAEILRELHAHENPEGFTTFNRDVAFNKGDKIEILEGPFGEATGLFEDLDDQGRVTLLLDLMGRQAMVKTSRANITAA